jgi:hypothetical protein
LELETDAVDKSVSYQPLKQVGFTGQSIRLFIVALLGVVIVSCLPTSTVQSTLTQNSPHTSDSTPIKTPVTTHTKNLKSTHLPFINLVSPNGGEEWKETQTYIIKWCSYGVEKVNIAMSVGGKDKGFIAYELDAESGEYTWTIPQGFISSFGISYTERMRVRVYDANDPYLYDENDAPFMIEAQNGSP